MKRRICRMCHKPSGVERLCKTCKLVKGHHNRTEETRLAALRESGWVPPEVTTIRNRK